MPLSAIQKGAIGQFAFLATALATGKGQVEAYAPVADNEGRDAEIRRHLKPAPGISIQVKVSFAGGGRRDYLEIRFGIPETHVQNDPRLWYFLAHYDFRELRLRDPVFLVPAPVFHRIGRFGNKNGMVWFAIYANLAATSRSVGAGPPATSLSRTKSKTRR